MNCQDYERLINKKLDRSLSPREVSLLEAHLAACPVCAQLAEEYLRLDQLLVQNIAQVTPPADLCSSVMAALPEGQLVELDSVRSKAKRRRSPVWRWAGAAVAAAAVFMGFLAGSWFEQSQPGTELPNLPPIQAEQEQPEQTPEQQKPFLPAREKQPDPEIGTELPVIAEQTPPEQQPEAEQPPQQQAPGHTEAPVEADPVEAPVTDPPARVEEPVDVSHNNEFSLPPVAYGNTSQGDYNLLTLASVEGYDAKLPLVKGTTVTFYVETEDAHLEYQVEISGAEPQFLGEAESLPSAKAAAGCASLEEDGFSGVEAISANGLSAQNRSGEEPSLWLLSGEEESKLTELGGGSLVSWSADGNKILFTDTEEHLHIYYVAEKILLDLNAAPVHSFCWGSDGRSIVFSALDAETGYYSIFTVIVP